MCVRIPKKERHYHVLVHGPLDEAAGLTKTCNLKTALGLDRAVSGVRDGHQADVGLRCALTRIARRLHLSNNNVHSSRTQALVLLFEAFEDS